MSRYNKLWVSLLGGVISTAYPLAQWHEAGVIDVDVSTAVVSLLTAVGVYLVPNRG